MVSRLGVRANVCIRLVRRGKGRRGSYCKRRLCRRRYHDGRWTAGCCRRQSPSRRWEAVAIDKLDSSSPPGNRSLAGKRCQRGSVRIGICRYRRAREIARCCAQHGAAAAIPVERARGELGAGLGSVAHGRAPRNEESRRRIERQAAEQEHF